MMLISLSACSMTAQATEPELIPKRATAYDLQGTTCTGKQVRDGIAASTEKYMIGKTIAMYQRLPSGSVGKLIGIYEVEDTGAMSTNVIDVWASDSQAFMNEVYKDGCEGKVFIQVIDAQG